MCHKLRRGNDWTFAIRRTAWSVERYRTRAEWSVICDLFGMWQAADRRNYELLRKLWSEVVERMIRTINAREAVEFLRENDLTMTRCKGCYLHKDIGDRCYCHKLEMYVDGDWFCKDAKANPCDTCFVPLFYNLEDDDSPCRDCEVEE